jgi:hypothetical protein
MKILFIVAIAIFINFVNLSCFNCCNRLKPLTFLGIPKKNPNLWVQLHLYLTILLLIKAPRPLGKPRHGNLAIKINSNFSKHLLAHGIETEILFAFLEQKD